MLGVVCRQCVSQLRTLVLLRGGQSLRRRLRLQLARQFHVMSTHRNDDTPPYTGAATVSQHSADSGHTDTLPYTGAAAVSQHSADSGHTDTLPYTGAAAVSQHSADSAHTDTPPYTGAATVSQHSADSGHTDTLPYTGAAAVSQHSADSGRPATVELAEGGEEHERGVAQSVRLTNDNLNEVVQRFCARENVRNAAAEYGLKGPTLTRALHRFSKAVCGSYHPADVGMKEVLVRIISGDGHVDDLFPFFLAFARQRYPMVVGMPQLERISDLAHPSMWFPAARSMKRKIFYHAGPTNSGKTHHALKHFLSAERAVYCAPLRMLAHEICQRSNRKGVPCDLLTGEEFQPASGDPTHHASHLACTVEMTNTDPGFIYDVGVLDEVQMMQDASRGGAWTRAILGLPCRELHVCGQETAVDLVKRIASSTGEEVEIHHYRRLTPLVPLDRSLRGDYTKVRSGDCIITFSRSKIFEVRKSIERFSKQPCAVIYGGLPPATRVQQANLFNSRSSHCNILVATDAIGMGMNLNIRRIVFHDLEKFNGSEIVTLSSQATKQIAGRAGRYGKDHARGEVTTFHQRDLDLMHQLMEAPDSDITTAGLYPTFDQIKLFSSHMPGAALHEILAMFHRMAKLDDLYFLCNVGESTEVAHVLRDVPLDLEDMFTFSHSPVDMGKPWLLRALIKFAMAYSRSQPVDFHRLCRILQLPLPPPTTPEQLATFEDIHETTDLYLWLHMRFPEYFVADEEVRELQVEVQKIIGQSIASRFQRKLRVRPQFQLKSNVKGKLLRVGWPQNSMGKPEKKSGMAARFTVEEAKAMDTNAV